MTVPKAEPEAADRRSLHERIAADLRDDIMSGELAPGASLPSTAQLRERFAAAGATVQKALRLLKDEHLVVGRAGASVTVREHRQRTVRPAALMAPGRPGAPYRWLTEAAKHGTHARSELLDVTEIRPPADVRAVLGLPPDGTALLRRQILLVDDEPAELVESYYPLDIARGTPLTELRRIRGGTPALLTELGHPPRRSTDGVSARVPTQRQYQALHLTSSMPVLRTLRVVHSDDDRPIEVTVMVKAGHLYELQYEFTAEPTEQPTEESGGGT
ncbi:transcriptional regulator, GntR family [Streptomyces sp. yr375]|uniref:GntR family transcriptional regulator n=1 Tax=Streptomyces sp. yr375 TaxID=1761906 RepID=UPI0008BBF5A1|nr:GntR family transcriptional regulator [Streptomyces sp. yr375]SER88339.1 transcriptional regulator, GntR family [Streptomyces sp. yr375]